MKSLFFKKYSQSARLWRRVVFVLIVGARVGWAEQADSRQPPKWRLGLSLGQWWETTLPDAPVEAVRGSFDLRDAYYLGANVNYNLTGPFHLPFWGLDKGIPFGGIELDSQVISHFGVDSDVWEVSGGIGLRSGDAPLGPLRLNVMIGEGLSYVFGELALEKGEEGIRGENQEQLQNHLFFEAEAFLVDRPKVALVLRLHHRSGVYGLISNSKTGSNWLSIGARARL